MSYEYTDRDGDQILLHRLSRGMVLRIYSHGGRNMAEVYLPVVGSDELAALILAMDPSIREIRREGDREVVDVIFADELPEVERIPESDDEDGRAYRIDGSGILRWSGYVDANIRDHRAGLVRAYAVQRADQQRTDAEVEKAAQALDAIGAIDHNRPEDAGPWVNAPLQVVLDAIKGGGE